MKSYIGRSVYPLFESPRKIHFNQNVYTAGSCFAQELATRLDLYKINNGKHPFGIVFNPLSFARQIDKLTSGFQYEAGDLIEKDGLKHSLDHHGSYSKSDSQQILNDINRALLLSKEFLIQSEYLVLTLGSAHYYTHKASGHIAANCHKIPSEEFVKKRADVDEIIQSLEEAWQKVKVLNPNLKWILTVSPVRYLRDGFVENNLSKASLLLSCNQLSQNLENVFYFPSYEIFMDDLRDYRYTTEDLAHPSQTAIDYIWSYFEHAYIDAKTSLLKQQMNTFHTMLNHRILHPDAESTKGYFEKLETILNALVNEFPEVHFKMESDALNSKKTEYRS